MEFTFTLTITPENSMQEKHLVDLGFEQEWDNSPWTFKTGKLDEATEMVHQLEGDGFEPGWVLEKVAH